MHNYRNYINYILFIYFVWFYFEYYFLLVYSQEGLDDEMGVGGAAAEDAEAEYIRKICEKEIVTGIIKIKMSEIFSEWYNLTDKLI